MHLGPSFDLDLTSCKALIRFSIAMGLLLATAGCEPSIEDSRDSKPMRGAAIEGRGHSSPGRPVTAEEIALWDVDVMPDGDHFVMIKMSGESREPVVALGWVQEVLRQAEEHLADD